MKAKMMSCCMLLGWIMLGVCFTAFAQGVEWRMTSTWTPAEVPIKGDKHFVDTVNRIGEGEIKIKFFSGGTLVPPFEVFDTVSKGIIQMGADSALLWGGKNTAFDLLGGYPMGMTPIDYMVWIYQGGGFELYQEVYGKFGIVYLPHGTNLESGIRSNKPIKSIADYRGLKVRMAGRTQGKIAQKIGYSVTHLAGGELYQALEKGVVDAGEVSSPSVDLSLGLHEVTRYWVSPPWHAPGMVYGIMINKSSWDSLPDKTKEILKTAAMATFVWTFSFLNHSDISATETMLGKGIEITRLPDEDLVTLQKIVNEYTLESCKENPLFAKVAYSQLKFLEDISKWRGIAQPFFYGRNPVLPDMESVKSFVK